MGIKIKPPTEQMILKQCLEVLALKGYLAWRVNSGAATATHKGKTRFVKFNSMPGCSDIIGVSPAGRFIAVEVKRPGNKPTDKQVSFLAAVADHGGIALWVTSADGLLRLLEDIEEGEPCSVKK